MSSEAPDRASARPIWDQQGTSERRAGRMTYRVLMTAAKFVGCEAAAREFLGQHGCELIEHERHRAMSEEALCELVPAADGLIGGLEPVTERVFARAPRLRVVCAPGVGYDHIDVDAATRRGIAVCIRAR